MAWITLIPQITLTGTRAKTGIKILISTFPFTFASGFLEGFITRYSNIMPHWLSVAIILITLSIISYYYLIYPFKIQKQITKTPNLSLAHIWKQNTYISYFYYVLHLVFFRCRLD